MNRRHPGPGAAPGLIAEMVHGQTIAYPVLYDDGLFTAPLPATMRGRGTLVVTTPTVDRLYTPALLAAFDGQLSADDVLVLPCSEASKTLEQVADVAARAAGRIGRDGLIIGFGGGTVMDIACFAASMIRRGVGHARIPTTLVGLVDAGIGVKGGVNFAGRKNYLGCFHAPETVLVQRGFLASLGARDISCGLSEMLKMAILCDAALFASIRGNAGAFVDSRMMAPDAAGRDAIVGSIRLMLDALRPNLTERASWARAVDFGHSFSPALEAATGFALPHGHAVAVDMALSAAISAERGTLAEQAFRDILATLRAAGLPLIHDALDAELAAAALDAATAHRGGQMNLVVPTGIGAHDFIAARTELPPQALSRALDLLASAAGGQGG